MKQLIFFIYIILFSVTTYSADQESLEKFFSNNKIGDSPDYAFMKNGIGGPAHLITIHGYADDKAVCEALASEYNGDPSLSTLPGVYECIQLNK